MSSRWLGVLLCPLPGLPSLVPEGWMSVPLITLTLSDGAIRLAPEWWVRVFAWWTWFNFPTRSNFVFTYSQVEGVDLLTPPYHFGALVGFRLTRAPYALGFQCRKRTADLILAHLQRRAILIDRTPREFHGSAFWSRGIAR